jgi:hypothetical protein
MKIGYPNTMNKPADLTIEVGSIGKISPLKQRKVLPDPKTTKMSIARRMKKEGEITGEEFQTYKKQYKANNTKRKPALTSGNTGGPNSKGDGGPNEDYMVAVPRKKWDRKVRMAKRGSKRADEYDAKLRASSPRARKYGSKETDYKDIILDPKKDKKAAKKRYREYKKNK